MNRILKYVMIGTAMLALSVAAGCKDDSGASKQQVTSGAEAGGEAGVEAGVSAGQEGGMKEGAKEGGTEGGKAAAQDVMK
jgi:hypothetical protein